MMLAYVHGVRVIYQAALPSRDMAVDNSDQPGWPAGAAAVNNNRIATSCLK
jgi:hypothetical protein